MTYSAAIKYIHSLERFGIMPGLERVRLLCEALGNPQERLQFIHVAGTNGKGSACTMMAEVLRAAGRRVGLYTSPYVIDFRERMQVNGEMIPREDVARLTQKLRKIPVEATEFEFITAMAFAWFAGQSCDVVVLEVGLGGRYDATNIIRQPMCSVIMKIAMDHTQVLGDTIEKIAAEKCGIIKPGCPVTTTCEQPPEALRVIEETARRQGCALHVPAPGECEIIASTIFGTKAILAGLPVQVPLIGPHMCRNALTVVRAAKVLGIPGEAVQRGIERAKMPARMEVLSRNPLVILDGGHNPDGAHALAAALMELLPGRNFTAVCGMMADKNVAEFLQAMRPVVGEWITCQPQNPRAMPAEELAALVRAHGQEAGQKATAAGSAQDALRLLNQMGLPAEGRPVLICGSFYLAGEVRGYFS